MMFRMLKASVFILGSCSYSSASKAFLFSLYNAKGYNPVKLAQYRYQELAMYSCSTHGPSFGWFDIRISNDALTNQGSRTQCGSTYSVPSGYSAGHCGFFTGTLYFTLTDIEVFYEKGNKMLAKHVWLLQWDPLSTLEHFCLKNWWKKASEFPLPISKKKWIFTALKVRYLELSRVIITFDYYFSF